MGCDGSSTPLTLHVWLLWCSTTQVGRVQLEVQTVPGLSDTVFQAGKGCTEALQRPWWEAVTRTTCLDPLV